MMIRIKGSSSSTNGNVSQGCVVVCSLKISWRREMPHRNRGGAVYGLINVICIFRIKLILIRGRFSTWGLLLSYPCHPSLIKWSFDDIHLAREKKAHYHTMCRGREFHREIWTQYKIAMWCGEKKIKQPWLGGAANWEVHRAGLL